MTAGRHWKNPLLNAAIQDSFANTGTWRSSAPERKSQAAFERIDEQSVHPERPFKGRPSFGTFLDEQESANSAWNRHKPHVNLRVVKGN